MWVGRVLAIVRTAAEVFVGRTGQGQFLFQRAAFQVVLENGVEAGIGTGAKVEGAPAGGFQALVAAGLSRNAAPIFTCWLTTLAF
jgi:hypothetical protein